MFRPILFLLGCLFLTKVATGQEFYAIDSVLEIRIQFAYDNWDARLDSLKQLGNDERLVADVFVNGVKYEKAGVRYKGNSSYFSVRKSSSSKLPFNIKTNFTIKGQKLPGGYETIKLSNVFRDPSFLREVLSYEIARKYMPASRANFAQVYVNDEYLGLYNCTESVDEEFLETYFGTDEGELIKCDPNWNAERIADCPPGDKASLMYLGEDSLCYHGLYEVKTDEGWQSIVELARVLNREPEKLEQVLNVDQALWMLAFNNVLVNLDSYIGKFCHNYYLYRDTFGVFQPIIWDMNLSFGGFRYSGLEDPYSNEDMQTMSPFVHYKEKNPKRPLIVQLLADDLYRKIYVAHLKTILDENFADSTYLKRALTIQKMIAPLVEADHNKLYAYEAFEQNLYQTAKADRSSIIGIVELMEKRAEYLSGHPLLEIPPPLISEVEHTDFGDILGITAQIEGAERAWLFYRHGPYLPFQRLEMFDDSGHNDQLENDGIWGTTIERKSGTQYYIVAEGARLAALDPPRASFEFYEFKEEKEAE